MKRLTRAAVVGLAIFAAEAAASEPARLPIASNQTLADAVAGRLRQSGALKGFTVDIAAVNGRVELTGRVADEAQRRAAIRVAEATPGVSGVTDRLSVGAAGITRVQAQAGPTIEGPPPVIPPIETTPVPGDGGVIAPPPGGTPPPGNGIPEPTPVFRAPVPAYYGLNPPPVPPHAWPTYAPYNNFSRVATPSAYPANAWPFIGPMYPFPKVPLGWRSVKLEWDDGYWWFSRTGTKYDWWKVRYW